MKNYVLPIDRLQQISEQMKCVTDKQTVIRLLEETLECYSIVNFEFNKIKLFWRGQKCASSEGFKNISRAGYPPKNLTRNNRMNEEGEPILYTCVNKYTVFEEIGAEAGDFIHLAGYELKQGAELSAAMIGLIVQCQRSGKSALSNEFNMAMVQLMNSMRPDIGKSFVFTDALMASILSDKNAKNSDYIRSRTLAKMVFQKLPRVESIFYPSVIHEGALNLAVKPKAADSKFFNKMNFVLRITRKYDYGFYDFEICRKSGSHNEDGTIVWE